MSNDQTLVARLRAENAAQNTHITALQKALEDAQHRSDVWQEEAADFAMEIERLRKRNQALEEALQTAHERVATLEGDVNSSRHESRAGKRKTAAHRTVIRQLSHGLDLALKSVGELLELNGEDDIPF